MPRSDWSMAMLIGGLASMASLAQADEVVLKNGDRISGKIVSAADGKVVMAPDFAPKTQITLSQEDVATLASTGPLVLKLKDGATLDQPVQTVSLSQIDAINPAAPPPPAWHGAVGVNGLYSNATTSSFLLGVSANGARRTDHDEVTLRAAYDYGEQWTGRSTTPSADNWLAGAKYDHTFAPRVYGYVSGEASGDKVNFLDLRVTPSAGAGYRWFDRPDFHLTSDAGLAYIYETYSTAPRPSQTAAVSVSYHVDRQWDSGRLSVFHDLQLLPALQKNQLVATGDAGFRTNITSNMYSEVRADLSYDNKPGLSAKETTTQIKLGLGWTY